MKTLAEKISFKIKLKETCVTLLKERIANALQAMNQAQESANNQEKSSVGDKHETSRAISQSERDMNARQLQQAEKDLQFVENMNVEQVSLNIVNGSVFKIQEEFFFVAIGLGNIKVENTNVMVISHQSPIFLGLKMKNRGEMGAFRGIEQKISEVF